MFANTLDLVKITLAAESKMRGHRFYLPFTIFLLHFMTITHGQSTSDFISIDCGLLDNGNYNDSNTRIPYVSDSQFIDTNEKTEVHSLNQTSVTRRHYQKIRSFPHGTRNCYKIEPIDAGVKYLVRASFKYGNYDGDNVLPKFDLYLGINFKDRIIIKRNNQPMHSEIIVVPISNSLSICLVNTGDGTPFISAIELRPLPNTLYSEANTSRSLKLQNRWNEGGGFARYPRDSYDRFWYAGLNVSENGWKKVVTNSPVITSNQGFGENSVMETAATPINASSININYSGRAYTNDYFIFYFAELETANKSRIFRILMNDVPISNNIEPKFLEVTTFNWTRTASSNREVSFLISEVTGSALPPILNAVERYSIFDMTRSETKSNDVDAIVKIKAFYKVRRNWMGDPCQPKEYMWEGLNCSYNGSNSPRIISLNLSSYGSDLNGEIAKSFANLTELQYLDLSSNSLKGEIPGFLANLSQLKVLNLSGNNLRGSIPEALHNRSSNGSLNLSTEGNPHLCTTSGSCQKGTNKTLIAVVASIGSMVVLLVVMSIVIWRRRSQKALHVGVQTKSSLPSLHSESKRFTFNELGEITNNFTKQIGRGGFGPVYHGIYGNGVQVAVKMLSCSSSQGTQEFQTEIQLLSRIHHRNLVPLIGYCGETDHMAIVYEYMAGGSLEHHLAGNVGDVNTFSWRERLRIASEAAQGLEYLHKGCKPAIVHRDVKTSNILLTENLGARIADFGLSKTFQDDGTTHVSTRVIGTLGYLDPEYYTTNQLTEKSDVYSFGVVLMELITGLPAILKGMENNNLVQWAQQKLERGEIIDIVDKRLRGNYDINSIWRVVEIAITCTAFKSLERPTIVELIAHLSECMELEMACEMAEGLNLINLSLESHLLAKLTPANDTSMMNPPAR